MITDRSDGMVEQTTILQFLGPIANVEMLLLQVAIWKEGTLEGTKLETRREASLLVVLHVIVDTNRTVAINVTLYHHLIDTANYFENTASVPVCTH